MYCEELLTNLKHDRVLVFQPMESEEEPSMDWNSLLSESHSDSGLSPPAVALARMGFPGAGPP